MTSPCPEDCPSCDGMRVVVPESQLHNYAKKILRGNARVTRGFWWKFWSPLKCIEGNLRWGTYAVVEMDYEETHAT